MNTVQQMFCTHCTHGSSALEQRDGELAERTFGYSVRAGSLEGDILRKCYQQVEPLVYYHLPRDTPDEQKLQLTATAAPRRFFFARSADGLQVCGHVCYRAMDSEGRPGSYFAHLLLNEDATTAWDVTEILRLWGAPGWVTQDGSEIGFKLEPLGSSTDLLQGGPSAIDDAVLASFLREAADSAGFSDPAGVIPERWRAMEPQTRRQWFLGIFATVVQSVTSDRQPLVLVAEPSIAALVFYVVLRLLPPGPLRDGLGFSTYEPDPDRCGALLSATWFFDPEAASRPETCSWQRTTINTLASPEGQKIAPITNYARSVVQRLLEKGGDETSSDLKVMATVPISAAKELDTLIEIDGAADELFQRGTFSPAGWRNWQPGIEYFRHKVLQRLSASSDVEAALKAVVGGQAHLALIDLLTGKSPPHGGRQAVVHLLKELPPEKVLSLLKLPSVNDDDKLTVLLRHIHAHGTLPPGCEFLWDEWAEAAEQPRRAGVVLMARILSKLPAKSMERFYAHVPLRCADGFLMNCLKLVQQKKMKLPTLTAMMRAADSESVFKLIRAGGAQFLANYPKNEPALGEKLVDVLRTLAKHPDDFKERLDVLLAGQHLLGEDVYHAATALWDKVYKSILEVGRLQRPDAGLSTEKRHALLVAACREMAMDADRAMTIETMDAEYPWNEKRDFLVKIGQRVLGGTPLFLPGNWESEMLLQRVDGQFQFHRFSTDPLKKEAAEKKKKEVEKKEKIEAKKAAAAESKPLVQTSKGLLVATIIMIVIISAAAIVGVYYFLTSTGSGTPKKRGPRDRARPKPSVQLDRREGGTGAAAAALLARSARGAEEEAMTASAVAAARPLTAAVATRVSELARVWTTQSG